jgi:hypothetical protein
MDNAIGAVVGGQQHHPEACARTRAARRSTATLFERPLPFSDHSPANFPTKVFNLSLNTAFTEIKGVDVEANYRFQALGGAWTDAPVRQPPADQHLAGLPEWPLTRVSRRPRPA